MRSAIPASTLLSFRIQRCPIASRSSWTESFIFFVHFLEMYVFLFKRNPASHYTMFILLLYSKSSRLSVRLSV